MRGYELMQARKYMRAIHYNDPATKDSLYFKYLEWYAYYLPYGATSRDVRRAANESAISIVLKYHNEQLAWLNGWTSIDTSTD